MAVAYRCFEKRRSYRVRNLVYVATKFRKLVRYVAVKGDHEPCAPHDYTLVPREQCIEGPRGLGALTYEFAHHPVDCKNARPRVRRRYVRILVIGPAPVHDIWRQAPQNCVKVPLAITEARDIIPPVD